MKVHRWSDGETSLNVVMPQARTYLYILGDVKMKSI